jgi:hypothetical protein
MWTLTGFADEISPELDEQLDTLADESIHYVELRSVWNKNVLDLTDDEIQKVGAAMSERGIAVSSIGSPIGNRQGPHRRGFRPAPGEVPPGAAHREGTGSPVCAGLLFLHASGGGSRRLQG